MSHRAQLFENLGTRPNDVAFRLADAQLTFGELHQQAIRWAGHLQSLGLQPGDRVACHLTTCMELIVVLVGNYYAGAVHVPINTRYGDSEIEHILQDSGATVLVSSGDDALEQVLAEAGAGQIPHRIRLGHEFVDATSGRQGKVQDTDDEATALMIYTSGTTGRSKGVELSYRAVVSNIDALTQAWRWTENDVLVLALPLFHVHGLCIGVHGVLLRATQAVLLETMSSLSVADEIDAGATIFMGVPTMYSMLLEHAEADPTAAPKLAKARLFTSGSAALSPHVFRRFQALTGHAILERYGMSETLLTLSNPYEGERRPGTVGFPVDGCEVRVVREDGQDCEADEVGQIYVRGNSMMTGYWQQPQQTGDAFEDGWFKTGDVAKRAADGYIAIVGRSSVDIIKSGGYKISAREIEDVLESHPLVTAIAVVGVPNEKWGEEICAGVVTRTACDGGALLTELQELGRAHLADYKTLRGLCLLPELPRNALGKVQKHRLRDAEFVRLT